MANHPQIPVPRRSWGALFSLVLMVFFGGQANAQLRWTSEEQDGPPIFIAFLPDNKKVVSAGSGRRYDINTWDTEKRKPIGKFRITEDESTLWGAAMSPDGFYLVTCGFKGKIQLWSIQQRRLRGTFKSKEGVVGRLVFGPNNRTVVAAGGNGVEFWDLRADKPTDSIDDKYVSCLAFSPDGETLAMGRYDGKIILWNVAGRKLRVTIAEHKAEVIALAFSPDSKLLASADNSEGPVRLWDVTTGQKKQQLDQGQLEPEQRIWLPRGVAFTPDGKLLAVVGIAPLEGKVNIWDVAAGGWRGPIKGPYVKTNCIAFSRDGKHFVTGGEDKTIRLFDMPAAK